MGKADLIHSAFCKIAGRLAAARRQSDFVCGDCERAARCSLPPTDNCIARVEQIIRGDWKLRRRAKTMSEWGV